jgi:hypothetical protein
MTERPAYSLAHLSLYFLKLRSIGFGGPVALVGYMYRDLVEARRWAVVGDLPGHRGHHGVDAIGKRLAVPGRWRVGMAGASAAETLVRQE